MRFRLKPGVYLQDPAWDWAKQGEDYDGTWVPEMRTHPSRVRLLPPKGAEGEPIEMPVDHLDRVE
jgi:hypothetical protein